MAKKRYTVDPEVRLPPLIQYKERLYPKPEKVPKDRSYRPWRVDYNLTYEGGMVEFSLYYRTRAGAIFAAFFHEHLKSYGGSAVLVHQPTERLLSSNHI